MEARPFGAAGRTVAAIGQGTWSSDRGERAAAVAALRRGLDAGLTHIDTAEMYDDAEPVVAEALAGRRDEVFLVSKVLPHHASRRGTIAACEESLRRRLRDEAVVAIPRASSAAHAAENAGAGDLRLAADESTRLDRAFPRGPRPRSLPIL